MNQNPLLLATLFLKHQPTAKTFEEAVAMEVESLKAEWVVIDGELNALAEKEQALLARKNDLLSMRRKLLGDDHAEKPATPPVVVSVAPPTLFQSTVPESAEQGHDNTSGLAPVQKNFTSTVWRRRAETDKQERRYDSYSYANAAKKLGLGVHEGGGIVWLTPEEWEKVYPIYYSGRKSSGNKKQWRRSNKQARTRAGTDQIERSYSGSAYVEHAKKHGVGSPGFGVVWLTDAEANAANKAYYASREKSKAA